MEHLYQQFSSGQKRTSLVVTNMIDILTRLVILALTWPSGWWGVACHWLAGLAVILWVGICVLALARKGAMTSPMWLRYAGKKCLYSRLTEFSLDKSSQWWVSVCTCLSLRYQSICLSQVPVCGQLVVTDTAGVGWCVQLARE